MSTCADRPALVSLARRSTRHGRVVALFAAAWLIAGAATAQTAHTLAAGRGEHAVIVTSGHDGEVSVVSAEGSARVAVPPATHLSSVAMAGERWFLAGITESPAGDRLSLVTGAGDTARALAPPAAASARLTGPVWAADDDAVHALVWLEGDRHDALAVRAARFDGRVFGPAETVAAPGPGTQIAVSAAILDDGGILLAWAAFDGQDDEILWSRTTEGGWTSPAPVAADDRYPDITPQLKAVDGGALLVWSGYDGNDYRVSIARFANGAWSEERTIGERGSVLPTVAGSTARPLIVYKTAVPRTWTVLAVAPDGRPMAKASMPLGTNHRPLVDSGSDDTELVLSWPAVADRVPPAKLVLAPLASAG